MVNYFREAEERFIMPNYDYKTKNFDKVVNVRHPVDMEVEIWGQVCFLAQISLGEIPYDEPVYKILSPTRIIKAHSNSELKERGFTKLVKRDAGVYENVTALDGESRYMVSGNSSSLPHFNKKIRD